MQKLRLNTASRFLIYLVCLVAALALLAVASGRLPSRPSQTQSAAAHRDMMSAIAYSVDFSMDKARLEKTVDHYGDDIDSIEDIAQQVIKNNVNNPQAKPTAENTYSRESAFNEALPRAIGDTFSEPELENMTESRDR